MLEAVGATGQRLRKEILLDGIKRPLSEVIGHFNAVIFVPQMVQIIEGGPEERRRYLNLALAQTVPGYAHVLSVAGTSHRWISGTRLSPGPGRPLFYGALKRSARSSN